MSKKNDLRRQREDTVINSISKKQEKRLRNSLITLYRTLTDKYGVQLAHERQWFLKEVQNDYFINRKEAYR